MTATPTTLDLAVIGGGASGFFTALRFAEFAPDKSVAIFEKSGHFLQKVRISGGGRCNVTHACYDPKDLSEHYPRGERELRAAFHQWQPTDTAEWFQRFGVELKTEPDGRMFPTTDSSETIIDCFLDRARTQRIPLNKNHALVGIEKLENGNFSLEFDNSTTLEARKVCIATGSLKASPLLKQLEKLELSTESLVPSLFAFNVPSPELHALAGVSHPMVHIRRSDSKSSQHGPILITHRGFSGPAVLRLSAWDARELAERNHRFTFQIDWLPEFTAESLRERFGQIRQEQGAKLIKNTPISPIPRRLWEYLVSQSEITESTTWGQLPKIASKKLLENIKGSSFEADGKTTNKDEFVTCGGINRKTINFKTMESRTVSGLHFTGECIDIDGITGGFNFQAAWTTAHLAATAIAGSLE